MICNHGRAYKLVGGITDPQLVLADNERATVTAWCPDCGSVWAAGKAWLMPREVAMGRIKERAP